MKAFFLLLFAVASSFSYAQSAPHISGEIQISKITYRGWPNIYRVSNGRVETIIVPAIGRVMEFRYVGGEDIFWENAALAGQTADPNSKEWANFGGDKSWPSPQADWPKMIGRNWPPPTGFDAVAYQAQVENRAVELISPVDAGIRVRRKVQLDPAAPRMEIVTSYEKVSGNPMKVGIGVITQVRDPQRLFMVLPKKSRFPKGYVLQQFSPPQDVQVRDGLVSLKRGAKTSTQIGSDADTLLWMNDKYVLRIDSPRVRDAEYADQGTNTTIFTSADPQAYVELETFGPLTVMKVGDHIERKNTYTLMERTEKDPEKEARKIAHQ